MVVKTKSSKISFRSGNERTRKQTPRQGQVKTKLPHFIDTFALEVCVHVQPAQTNSLLFSLSIAFIVIFHSLSLSHQAGQWRMPSLSNYQWFVEHLRMTIVCVCACVCIKACNSYHAPTVLTLWLMHGSTKSLSLSLSFYVPTWSRFHNLSHYVSTFT